MNLVVLGATGRTGSLVVEQALAAGHTVTALVRSPQKVTAANPNLRVIAGEATDTSAVARAIGFRAASFCASSKRSEQTFTRSSSRTSGSRRRCSRPNWAHPVQLQRLTHGRTGRFRDRRARLLFRLEPGDHRRHGLFRADHGIDAVGQQPHRRRPADDRRRPAGGVAAADADSPHAARGTSFRSRRAPPRSRSHHPVRLAATAQSDDNPRRPPTPRQPRPPSLSRDDLTPVAVRPHDLKRWCSASWSAWWSSPADYCLRSASWAIRRSSSRPAFWCCR